MFIILFFRKSSNICNIIRKQSSSTRQAKLTYQINVTCRPDAQIYNQNIKRFSSIYSRHSLKSNLSPSAPKICSIRYQSNKPEGISLQGSHSSNIELHQDRLSLTYGEYHLELLYIWLRDHCRSPKCYNHKTNQKNVDNYSLPLDITPRDVDYNGTVLTLLCKL